MTVFGNVMAAKDLLPKMLELRGRNYTYKQIGEELGISPSLVGKHLKEVRDKPELAFEFIELKNFETGQTVLSFTPENFEKYRQTTILYYLGTSVFEIRSGLIHKTDFGPYQTKGKLRSKLPEWYPMVTKLYSVEDWFEPIYRRGENATTISNPFYHEQKSIDTIFHGANISEKMALRDDNIYSQRYIRSAN